MIPYLIDQFLTTLYYYLFFNSLSGVIDRLNPKEDGCYTFMTTLMLAFLIVDKLVNTNLSP